VKGAGRKTGGYRAQGHFCFECSKGGKSSECKKVGLPTILRIDPKNAEGKKEKCVVFGTKQLRPKLRDGTARAGHYGFETSPSNRGTSLGSPQKNQEMEER